MSYIPQDTARTREQVVGIRDYLWDHGPKTAYAISKELCIHVQVVYSLLRFGEKEKIVAPVAHIHVSQNHRIDVWDVFYQNEEQRFIRGQRLRGIICLCVPGYKRVRHRVNRSFLGHARRATYEPNRR